MPGIFVYQISDKSTYATCISSVYVLCALIRLAYFNVQEAERQKVSNTTRESYLGIPVTTIALLLPILYTTYAVRLIHSKTSFIFLLLITSIGFVSGFEIKKPKFFGKTCIVVLGILETLSLVFI